MKELQHQILNQASELELARDDHPDVESPTSAEPPTVIPLGLAGRVDELSRLVRALDAARDGHGSAVLIAGPAGIGKTRLVAELAEHPRARGARVLRGRSIQLVGSGSRTSPSSTRCARSRPRSRARSSTSSCASCPGSSPNWPRTRQCRTTST